MRLTCNVCPSELTRHCDDIDCGWWVCTDKSCTAATYDVRRGWLINRDGTVCSAAD